MSDERPEKQAAGAKAAEKARAMAGAVGGKIRSIATSPEVRGIRALTWFGLALTAAFFVCMFIDTVNIRWWIMLPLGAAGVLVLWKQWKSTPEDRDLELRLSFIGLFGLLALILLRDAWISSSIADIYEKAKEAGGALKEFDQLIGH